MARAADNWFDPETMSLALVADADLVAGCRRGEQAAWDELVNRFSRYVYAISTQAYGLRQHDAEDVFQEVFARTYERLDELRDEGAIRPWIGTLTRRLCIDRLRGSAREQLDEEPIDLRELDRETEERMDRLDESFEIHELLRTLPEHCGEILDRFFAQDESYATIGDALGLAPGTVASRISRCLARLRRKLEGREPRFQPSSRR
jgi:RNA polymerase sigma factor (sigma-70 family)